MGKGSHNGSRESEGLQDLRRPSTLYPLGESDLKPFIEEGITPGLLESVSEKWHSLCHDHDTREFENPPTLALSASSGDVVRKM